MTIEVYRQYRRILKATPNKGTYVEYKLRLRRVS